MESKRFTAQDIRNSYTVAKAGDERHGEWFAHYVYRPLSFYLTPLLLGSGASPTQVTLLSLALAVSLPIVAVWVPWPWLWVAGLGFMVGILDCADGNMARVTGKVSTLGHYADFITDVVFRITLYGSIGLIAGENGPQLGLAAALLAVTARLSRVYIEDGLQRNNPYTKPDVQGDSNRRGSLQDVAFSALSGIDGTYPLLTGILGACGGIEVLLWWIVGYSALDFLYTQYQAFKQLR